MEGNKFLNPQIVHLVRCISCDAMESISLRHLGLENEKVKNLKSENRDNAEAFNHEIIRCWM